MGWAMYDKIVHRGTLEWWRIWVSAGALCPACSGEKLMTWPANEPTEAPEDRTTACPICCEQDEFSELPEIGR